MQASGPFVASLFCYVLMYNTCLGIQFIVYLFILLYFIYFVLLLIFLFTRWKDPVQGGCGTVLGHHTSWTQPCCRRQCRGGQEGG